MRGHPEGYVMDSTNLYREAPTLDGLRRKMQVNRMGEVSLVQFRQVGLRLSILLSLDNPPTTT